MVVGVTGSTGSLGGMVARLLSEAGTNQRLVVREAARAPQLPGSSVGPFGGYADRASAEPALRGLDVLFMVSAHESLDRVAQHTTFIAAAAAAGVRHVVYTSFIGAAPEATFTLARDHWHTEEALRASGMRYTVLRDNIYMDMFPLFGGDDGVIRGPAGQGRIGAVTRADVARVAATVLRDPGAHAGATYNLTGSEALTLDEIARTITDVTGRPTTFHDETIEEAYAARARYNAPAWQVEAWVSTYLAMKNGEMAAVTTTVKDVTGRAPVTLREFLSA